MGLFKAAEMQQSFLKMGLYGDPKSGKTYTSTLVAIGLHKKIKSKKPVTFFDTETGSEYVLDTFKKHGIKLQTVKSRSFADLLAATTEAAEISDILIVDSVTHVWKELQTAYKAKKGVTRILLQDWDILKTEWQAFTDLYLNCKLHMIVCGRAQDIREDRLNENGKLENVVVGSKMATEKHLAYEPSLLVEMERVADQKTGFLTPRAWILGDRFPETGLSGKVFDNPTFETFLPHIERLNLGGEHIGIDVTRNSEALFDTDDGRSLAKLRHDQQKWSEEIEATLIAAYPGQTATEKKKKLDLLKMAFGGYSWTAIQDMRPEALQLGLLKIREAITADLESTKTNGTEKTKTKASK